MSDLKFDPADLPDISHLHEGERNRIRRGQFDERESLLLRNGQNPWTKSGKPEPLKRTLRPDEYPKGNVAHTRGWEPGDPIPPKRATLIDGIGYESEADSTPPETHQEELPGVFRDIQPATEKAQPDTGGKSDKREPTDEELLEFMSAKTKETWRRTDLTNQDRARIWQGNKKLYFAAQKARAEIDKQSPPPSAASSQAGDQNPNPNDFWQGVDMAQRGALLFKKLFDSDKRTHAQSERSSVTITEPQLQTTPEQEKVAWFHRIPVWKEFGPWLKWASAGFGFAVAMTQVNEYGWALAGLILCGVCCLGQIYVWTASPNRLRNTMTKIFLALLSVSMITIAWLTVLNIKGEKPWSNLSGRGRTPPVPLTASPEPAASPAVIQKAESSAQSQIGNTQERIPLDIAPETLLEYFAKYNEAQAEGLIEPHIGKWIELSGRVTGVRRAALLPREGDRTLKYGIEVTFSGRRADRPKAKVVHRALFDEQRWMDRAVVLQPKEVIKVRGPIKHVYFYGFYLEHCEIIE